MKKNDNGKLDQISGMLADMMEVLGKRFDRIDATLHAHSKSLDDHTRRLNTIEHDVKTNLDKRMLLETRIAKLENARK
jgi:chromosome segregation ATPase